MKLKTIWDNFKSFFKKDDEELEEEIDFVYQDANFDLPKVNEDDLIPEIKCINYIDDNKPSILIVEDFQSRIDVLIQELNYDKSNKLFETFNIYTASSEYAAFAVEKYIIKENVKIDLAILDITFGGILNRKDLDGVDLAIMLKEKNPNCEILFFTGHTLNRKNPEIFSFIKKFEDFFKLKIDEIMELNGRKVLKHVVLKNENVKDRFAFILKDFLKKYKQK